MKLRYKVDDIGNNVYQAYPQSLEACCNQSLVWLMGGRKSWNVVNSYIIKQVDEKTTENFYFCQFCGAKHEAVEIKMKEKEAPEKKQK